MAEKILAWMIGSILLVISLIILLGFMFLAIVGTVVGG